MRPRYPAARFEASRDFAQIGCCDAKSGARREEFSAFVDALSGAVAAASTASRWPCASTSARRCVANRAAVFAMFFRERFRAERARDRFGDGHARASSPFRHRPRRERDGTFVLQKY